MSDRATDGGLEFKYLTPLLAERAVTPGMTSLFPLGLGCDPGTGGCYVPWGQSSTTLLTGSSIFEAQLLTSFQGTFHLFNHLTNAY